MWANGDAETAASQNTCRDDLRVIGTVGTASFWFTLEAIELCFPASEAAENIEEKEEEIVEDDEEYGEEEA